MNKSKSLIRRYGCLDCFVISALGNIKSTMARTYIKTKKAIYNMLNDKDIARINIGGGIFVKKNWKVLDCIGKWYNYDKIFVDFNFNLISRDKFPLRDNSVDIFYSSHTFEHIPEEYIGGIFSEINRCLKPERPVRIAIPNIDLAYQAYRDNNAAFFISSGNSNIEEKFLDFFATDLKKKINIKEFKSNFGKLTKEDFLEFYRKKIDPSTQFNSPGNHINWFDYNKLKKILKQAGFRTIYRSFRQGSKFNEMKGSDFDSTYPEMSLFVEALK